MTIYFAQMHLDAGGIGFTIPDLPGFSAHHEGDDVSDAIKTAEAVLRDWIASNIDRGIAVPEASSMHAVGDMLRAEMPSDGYALTLIGLRARFPAGRALRVNLSVDERTLAEIDEKARARNMTRSAFLVEAAMAFD